jgi:hypothetical protein
VYCLVKGARRPSLGRAPAGIGGGAVRTLDAGDGVWLIVSTVPEPAYGEAAVARGLQDLDWIGRQAMAHEAVVERFLAAPAVLPMKLLTLFTSDDRALQHVRRDRRRIAAILGRVERQTEWGVRLMLDEQAVRQAAGAPPARRAGSGPLSGTAYLARQRDQIASRQARLADAIADANRLYRTMARAATAAVRLPLADRPATESRPSGSRLVLDAAFLVPRRRAAAFRTLLRGQGRLLKASGLVASLTGPWPPYNFVRSARAARRP